jgi:hypothetical protein
MVLSIPIINLNLLEKSTMIRSCGRMHRSDWRRLNYTIFGMETFSKLLFIKAGF